jgi:hypothetical protein
MMPSPSSPLENAYPLAVPEPAVARHPDTLTNPRELRRWLDRLPHADPGQMVQQLSRQLSLLVRDPRPDGKFGVLLKSYHAPLNSLQQQALATRQRSAETRTHAQISLLTSLPSLFQELANGHMRAVKLCLEAGKAPEASDIFAAQLLMRRAIHWELLEYRMFRPTAWQQVAQLYNVATLHRLEGVSVECELIHPGDPSNTHDLFFSTLALLLADPYRLPSHCIRELEQRLPRYAAKLDLNSDNASGSQLPLELSGQTSPLHYARQPDPSLPPQYLSLDRLLNDLHPGKIDAAGCDLDAWLQQSLSGLLGDNHERRHQRRARNADYHFVVGVQAVHLRLRSLQPGQSDNDPKESDSAPAYCGMPCVQVDVSSSGSGFILPGNQRYPDPGEWALFELDTPPGDTRVSGFIGQIKRCMRDEDDYLRIGVERLTGNVIPVNLGTKRSPALLNADQTQRLYRLIAPHGYFEAGKQDTLFGSNKNYRVEHLEVLSREGNTEIISLLLQG